jgi:ubiquinone/menaquinone biosynthesis C-methylase UbiE
MNTPVTSSNIDRSVVASFGQEWHKFDHADTSEDEQRTIFDAYFEAFPWSMVSGDSVGFDVGCGSGRWAYFVAPRVGVLHCVDPSPEALQVATEKLSRYQNCRMHLAAADAIPLPDGSADFGYSIGVLHHLPDTRRGIADCARKLKPGAPFLVYLYYRFDNRPLWFRALWKISDIGRYVISRLPSRLKLFVADVLAVLIYWPLARFAKLCESLGLPVQNFPLTSYRNRSFIFMRNDSLDRFGTVLEQRFTRDEIRDMMQSAGLNDIRFGTSGFWTAVGIKAS